jgi:plasmid replication initiation protein
VRDFRSAALKRYVRVTANATHGMATIWDLDVLIWAVSQINEGLCPPSWGKGLSPNKRFTYRAALE